MHPLVRHGSARLTAAAILVLVASLGACSGSGAGASPNAGGITVTGAWVRNSPAVAGAVAGYFVVKNESAAADALLSASTPIAKTVQLHKTVVMGSAAPSSSSGSSAGMGDMGSAAPSVAPSAGTGSGAMMGMVPVDRVDIPAGGSVEFKPGSYHLMIMELTGALTVGQTVDLTLVFEKAGTITVKAEVRAS